MIETTHVPKQSHLRAVAAEQGTPLYAYDIDMVRERAQRLTEVISWPRKQLLYAIKANPCPAIARTMFDLGFGCDCVAPGEVALAKALGLPTEKILLTENNLSNEEMTAALADDVLICAGSLDRLQSMAQAGAKRAAVRFNPDVGASEHAHTLTAGPLTKFGVHHSEVKDVVAIERATGLKVVGCHMHIGSGSLDASAFVEAMQVILSVAQELPHLEFIDFGGGLGVPYKPEQEPVDIAAIGAELSNVMSDFCQAYGRELELRLEPGRWLSAECGSLVTMVTAVKTTPEGRIFIGCDSGFNHLIRPMMYGSYHGIRNLSSPDAPPTTVDVVGNICESGDIFARDRVLPLPKVGDVLSIDTAGAYGMSMGSTYNLRPLPAEVALWETDGQLHTSLERPRLSIEALLQQWTTISGDR